MSTRVDAFVVAAPGLETLAHDEVRRLGVRPARVVRGGVECTVTWPQLWAINLRSRVATRVLVRVARFRADGFDSLRTGLRAVDWSAWLPEGGVRVEVTADRSSRLFHTGAVEQRVTEELARAEGPQAIHVRVQRDVVTVSLDASGDSLHQRGWRGDGGKAPLRETLAAALILGAGWDVRAPLVDPFCGSGTIVIEAAMMARRMAPGRHRTFSFQRWPSFEPEAWDRLIRGADDAVIERCPPIIGSDRDAGAIESARVHAAAAGVSASIELDRRTVSELVLPPRAGWIVCNPPYGRRVGGGDLRDLFDRFGAVLRESAPRWHVGLLVPRDVPVSRLKVPLSPALRTTNGGIAVAVLVGEVPARAGD